MLKRAKLLQEFQLYWFIVMDELDKGNFDARSNVLTTINTESDTPSNKCLVS